MTPAGRMTPATHEQRMKYLDGRLKDLGAERCRIAFEIGGEGEPDLISGALLLAISIRESGCRNVAGDEGHARGHMQIHDAYHRLALRAVVGCRMSPTIAKHTSECWIPVAGTTALDEGMCPTFEDGCRIALAILQGYVRQAQRSDDVPARLVLRTAVAAFNAGFGAAEAGANGGHPDKATTGGNYSEDTLLRRNEIHQFMARHPNWKRAPA